MNPVIIPAIAEIVKLLIQVQTTAIKAGLTPEQLEEISNVVRAGFDARDPSKLPEA